MSIQKKLQAIQSKYCNINYNEDNYSVGGGLTDGKFASNRHEDAKFDEGKLTLGECTQLFKKATGLETKVVTAIIEYKFPNLEWHHAGKLPKQYGGGMKKTYFVNANEICQLATNWEKIADEFNEKLSLQQRAKELAIEKQNRLQEFRKANATFVERVTNIPDHFDVTSREMNGKYGWFEAQSRYNMPIYYSGWQFPSEELYLQYSKMIHE